MGYAEGEGLARAGLGDTDEVLALDGDRDGLELNWRRDGELERIQQTHQAGRNTQSVKTHLGGSSIIVIGGHFTVGHFALLALDNRVTRLTTLI